MYLTWRNTIASQVSVCQSFSLRFPYKQKQRVRWTQCSWVSSLYIDEAVVTQSCLLSASCSIVICNGYHLKKQFLQKMAFSSNNMKKCVTNHLLLNTACKTRKKKWMHWLLLFICCNTVQAAVQNTHIHHVNSLINPALCQGRLTTGLFHCIQNQELMQEVSQLKTSVYFYTRLYLYCKHL